MRLFVALDIPEEVRDALAKLVLQFSNTCRGARWARAENLHITLKFIGEVDETALAPIKASLAEINFPHRIEILFRNFGFFPNERHPRVFWAGMDGGEALPDLARQIDAKLQPLGFPVEERDFRPHLTLARFNSNEGLSKLQDMIKGLPTQELGRTIAREFHLYQSTLKRGGAEYARLATFALGRGFE